MSFKYLSLKMLTNNAPHKVKMKDGCKLNLSVSKLCPHQPTIISDSNLTCDTVIHSKGTHSYTQQRHLLV